MDIKAPEGWRLETKLILPYYKTAYIFRNKKIQGIQLKFGMKKTSMEKDFTMFSQLRME